MNSVNPTPSKHRISPVVWWGSLALLLPALIFLSNALAPRSHPKTDLPAQRETFPVRSAGPAPTQDEAHTVTYRVTRVTGNLSGGAMVDTTYEMPSGTAQKSLVVRNGAPTVVDTRTAQSGDFVYLSVQNDEHAATIRCEISVGGQILYRTQSQGAFKIASCSGRVP